MLVTFTYRETARATALFTKNAPFLLSSREQVLLPSVRKYRGPNLPSSMSTTRVKVRVTLFLSLIHPWCHPSHRNNRESSGCAVAVNRRNISGLPITNSASAQVHSPNCLVAQHKNQLVFFVCVMHRKLLSRKLLPEGR